MKSINYINLTKLANGNLLMSQGDEFAEEKEYIEDKFADYGDDCIWELLDEYLCKGWESTDAHMLSTGTLCLSDDYEYIDGTDDEIIFMKLWVHTHNAIESIVEILLDGGTVELVQML
jgi:hypothetical protein